MLLKEGSKELRKQGVLLLWVWGPQELDLWGNLGFCWLAISCSGGLVDWLFLPVSQVEFYTHGNISHGWPLCPRSGISHTQSLLPHPTQLGFCSC
jgi:hypothetical protein